MRQLREWAAQLREQRPAVSRASSVTALFAGVGAFLSMIGAFGADHVPLAPRTLYFSGAMACGALIGLALNLWVGRQAWIGDRAWARFGLVAFLAAPVMGVAVWASEPLLTSASPSLDALPTYLLVAWGMSAAMTLFAALVFSSRRTQASASVSALAARLPLHMRHADIWALEAEDHYLRVHTRTGSTLILMRLSDAIAELGMVDGAQTHRSWWVARSAVTQARRVDERAVLTLPNGVEAPVSRRFAPALRRAGWL